MLLSHLRQSFRNPDHWVYGAWIDFVSRYRRMSLGILWAVVPPIVYVWGIGGFLRVLQPGLDKTLYLPHVAIAFVLFRFITTSLTDAVSLFPQYRAYIFDGSTRLTDFVLRNLLNSLLYLVIAAPVVLAAMIPSPHIAWAGVPAAIGGLALVLATVFAYAIVLAFAGARLPDISEVMGSLTMALFLVTPIVWLGSQAPEGTLHGTLMRANPFFHLIEVVRAPLFGEAVAPSTYAYVGIALAAGLLLAAVSYRAFSRRLPIWL